MARDRMIVHTAGRHREPIRLWPNSLLDRMDAIADAQLP
jgi:hypothetical protein